jgi:hypothetical protein
LELLKKNVLLAPKLLAYTRFLLDQICILVEREFSKAGRLDLETRVEV